MKNLILKWELAGMLFVIVLGTLLHFTYTWSGQNMFVGVFSAVNESVWEHLKLGFWPAFAFVFIEYFFFGNKLKNYFLVKEIEVYSIVILIPVLFYTYTGILGYNTLPLDISTFVISVIAAKFLSYELLNTKNKAKFSTVIPLAFLFFLAALFVIFTFYPPILPFFKDPIENTYGIFKLG